MSLRSCGLLARLIATASVARMSEAISGTGFQTYRTRMSLRSCGLLARLIATASVARMERSEIRDWLPNVPHPHVAALMRATCSPHRNSKRSPDERSDIRDWLPNVPHPHVAALMRATCSPHRNSKRSPDGAKRNPGLASKRTAPACRCAHAGYLLASS